QMKQVHIAQSDRVIELLHNLNVLIAQIITGSQDVTNIDADSDTVAMCSCDDVGQLGELLEIRTQGCARAGGGFEKNTQLTRHLVEGTLHRFRIAAQSARDVAIGRVARM